MGIDNKQSVQKRVQGGQFGPQADSLRQVKICANIVLQIEIPFFGDIVATKEYN